MTSEVVPEIQCGFRGNRSTVDMIFCLQQLQEKCTEQDRPLYMVSVDFSKAFDTVGRTGLWQLLRKYYGCPEKFTTMIEAPYTGMMANARVGGEVSESFIVTTGKSGEDEYPVGPFMIGLFLFVVCGSVTLRLQRQLTDYSTRINVGDGSSILRAARFLGLVDREIIIFSFDSIANRNGVIVVLCVALSLIVAILSCQVDTAYYRC
ncbi:hypothetical protein NP493_446g01000 [Ridgeia piscesae]|uniref:Reverse transcriptase domain-containing protein n=1 Tax=Ridgeia piscesae TaxID=27915 RepID=A0AAD9KZR6_RIDPI|nr:hypothetical protein NP493_446g01000 [Ridgeia piscesae]